ncbi:MarR family winged helix-turn-helix transcriptional regulator [Asticcacaulis sp. AC402]|uniref:MarR family winged helix-turn-helix transcriptional regulator n=1 Tax=Asticcacaulis sp. AC402 TaxID=1282361 RepID=UPI0003C3EA3D|nr:MarR family transcriptional regulator [Asticcacaulis sp. AC402]ESQ75864.1 MarR family transcriptional regulator [Asticcacaulis sp. AC402]
MSNAAQISPLTRHLGYWLRFVSNHVSHAFAQKVEARGVTVAEWVVLRELLENGPMSPSALADHLGLTRGAITKLADRLIVKSMIGRAFRLDDRRCQILEIHDKGRELVPLLAALADRNECEFFGHMSESDRETLGRLMRDLVRYHKLKTIPTE